MLAAPPATDSRTIHDLRSTAPPAKLRIRLPRPHIGAQRVLSERRRFNWLCASRRWRKTTVLMADAIEAAANGMEILWGAPKYDQGRTAWDEALKMADGVADFNLGRSTITLPRGGRIMVRTLDNPHSTRSKTADRAYIDEGAFVKPYAWHEVIRPILASTEGDAWIASSPKGLNWFWEEWIKASGGTLADSAAWHAQVRGARIVNDVLVRAPHRYENPDFPWSEMLSMFNSMPRAKFRQEILAEFVDSGDMVFSAADVTGLAAGWSGLAEPVKGRRYLHAWDLGRKRDATVGITVDWTLAPYQVVAYERMVGVPWPLIQRKIAERHLKYGGRTFVEENGIGDPVISNLDIRAEGFTTSAKSKAHAITALQFLVEAHQLKVGIPQVTAELRGYRWDDDDLVQDCVMALAIAAATLPKPDRAARNPNRVATPESERVNRPSLTLSEMDW